MLFRSASHLRDELLSRNKENNKKEETSKVVVDIKGMVTNPGVYEVDSTMRVNDVILLAGGLIEGADTSLINLAKIVTDEMTIIIYSNEEIIDLIKENFDLRPAAIIRELDLKRPIYRQVASYGHFGREDLDLSWEKLDKVEQLKR